jgi:hypothetical protein
MNDQKFLANYLWPSDDKLDRTFAHPLPNIEGLKKCGDFIVQCEMEDTFSTNIITKYKSEISEVKLIDVHKNTQNKVTGIFTRLVGTMSLVKTGYPFLVLDAPVRNATVVTAEAERNDISIEDITTMVFILLPQADPVQRQLFFSRLREQVKEGGISYQERQSDILPGFYGPTLLVESKGIKLDLIWKLRDYAWNSYKDVIEQTKEKSLFDYRPFQEHMIFDTAQREHLSFGRRGLSVPVEAQAAFFSVMVSGL